MNSRRLIAIARWFGAALGVVAIVAFYSHVVRVNATTAALTFLLFILFLATRWGLRYAVVTSLFATACYNYFFLPPLHTFTVTDPENIVALAVLLITSIVASRLSERIRAEARATSLRERELQVLYGLSRELLQTKELSELTNWVPGAVATACGARSAIFYLLQNDRVYRYGSDWPEAMNPEELRAFANTSEPFSTASNDQSAIPLRAGVRPRGVLLLRGVSLSNATLEAIGGLVSVSLDRASAVEELTRAEAAKESERLRTMMMDSITHEIRSPLTAIKLSISTLRSMELAKVQSSELLEVIEEETDRLNRLVSQSVQMSSLDTLDVSMSFTPQRLADLIEAAVEASETLLAHNPVRVSTAAGLPLVDVDPEWISKVIANLLENAVKYSHPGQPIVVSAERQGEMVACSVADRGIGIDPLEQALIFDKFYRSRERAANVSGTGMGLAICKAILDAHGGTITLTSQPGLGSVFTFTVRVAGT